MKSSSRFSTTLLCKTWLAYTCRQHSSPILHFSTTLFPKILLQHFSTTLTLLKRFTATLFSKSSLEHLLYLTTLFPALVYKECKKLWTWCSCAPATRHKTKKNEVKKLLHPTTNSANRALPPDPQYKREPLLLFVKKLFSSILKLCDVRIFAQAAEDGKVLFPPQLRT